MVSEDCAEWLRYARMDIDAAHQLFSNEQNPRQRPVEVILYHCQQGAEKALKAYIVQNGLFPPKSHGLQGLRLMCRQWSPQFDGSRLVGHCTFLDPFAVIVRYPYHNISLDSVHAARGINSSKRIYNFVCERLGLKKYYS
ncbi:MAG: HEPN domain-containing protein [Methanomassiliicoccaceae archaeon]|nr:HEPN domain-containing protein [Methanomassiliicoccaceae archaeon]